MIHLFAIDTIAPLPRHLLFYIFGLLFGIDTKLVHVHDHHYQTIDQISIQKIIFLCSFMSTKSNPVSISGFCRETCFHCCFLLLLLFLIRVKPTSQLAGFDGCSKVYKFIFIYIHDVDEFFFCFRCKHYYCL